MTKAGYVAGAVRTFVDAHTFVLSSPVESGIAAQFIPGGEVMAPELNRRLDHLLIGAEAFGQAIDPSIPVFSTTSSSAVAACSSICLGPLPVRFSPCPYLDDSDETAYAQKLESLDPVDGLRASQTAMLQIARLPGELCLSSIKF